MKKRKTGYTTGTCAAAAAAAAGICLLTGEEKETVTVHLPGGRDVDIPIFSIEKGDNFAEAVVKKFSGDDPDITNGILVHAKVTTDQEGVFHVTGGCGIGKVTRPGLDQPPGSYAINSVPRKMIRRALIEAAEYAESATGLKAEVSMPEGVTLARKTFNPRLGIEGGLSILGTTGIVEPMSEQALVATIKAEISVRIHEGHRYILAAPGNYGLDFLKETYGIGKDVAIKCSNYVGETIDLCVEKEAVGVLFVAHIGKFIKVAGGIMNTHSKNADSRMELIAANALRAGIDPAKAVKALKAFTTEEALQVFTVEERNALLGEILPRIEEAVLRRSGESLKAGVILFSSTQGYLGMSEGASDLLEAIRKEY